MDEANLTENASDKRNERGNDIQKLREQIALLRGVEDGIDWNSLGDSCGKLGDILAEEGRLADAVQAYQEAVDAFGNSVDEIDKADFYARKVVAGVRELWKTPSARLDLLLAKLEGEQRQLTTRESAPSDIAEVSFKTATILHRRDRFREAEAKYLQTLSLLEGAEGSEIRLAETEMRIAGLYQYELNDPLSAVGHYRKALALFTEFEELSEGEQMNRKLCEELLEQAQSSADSPLP